MKINPITITEAAKEEIRNIIANKNIPDGYKLRIGIKGGVGCAGVNYVIGFDKTEEYDNEFDVDGIQLVIDRRHTMFLMGVQLDYYGGSDAQGFSFTKNENLHGA